jgi:hypothetical protein
MTFEELREAIKKLNCEIKSDAVAFYFEAVFLEEHRVELETRLSLYFNAPLKSANQSPTPESDACAGRYGGAKANQTLYMKKNAGDAMDVALIWPWNAGGRYTLKLIRG